MVSCTGCRDITEIMLKMILKTIQSINQSNNLFPLKLSFYHTILSVNDPEREGFWKHRKGEPGQPAPTKPADMSNTI